jgi:hypothetical protein
MIEKHTTHNTPHPIPIYLSLCSASSSSVASFGFIVVVGYVLLGLASGLLGLASWLGFLAWLLGFLAS